MALFAYTALTQSITELPEDSLIRTAGRLEASHGEAFIQGKDGTRLRLVFSEAPEEKSEFAIVSGAIAGNSLRVKGIAGFSECDLELFNQGVAVMKELPQIFGH